MFLALARFSVLLFAPGFSRRDRGTFLLSLSALQRGFSIRFSAAVARILCGSAWLKPFASALKRAVWVVGRPHSPRLKAGAMATAALALLATLAVAESARAASGGAADLALSVDKKEAFVAEPLTVTLSLVTQGGSEVVEWPQQGSHWGDFETISAERPTTRKMARNAVEHTLRLRVACYDTGDHALGPATVRWRPAAGAKAATNNTGAVKSATPPTDASSTLSTESTASTATAIVATESDATTITIRSVLPADAQAAQLPAKPVRPPVALPMDRRFVALLCAGAALLALLVAGLAVWLVRRSRAAAARPVPPPPLLDPDEEALRALAELEMTGAAEHDTADALYTRLSFVLRRYLGRRYRFDALDMTSGELLGTLERAGWGEELWRLMRADLAEGDFVKFARYAPPRTRRAEAIARVREIVTQSRPRAAAPTPTAEPEQTEPA
jgi:hypothetical protein